MENQTVNNSNSSSNQNGGEKTKSTAIDIPSISLPKGGGAIKGIDEKFSVNAVNGTSGFSLPLPFSPVRGASPSLSLTYNSGAGNGIFGLGWNLSLPSIKRKTDKKLPEYLDEQESDIFLFSEAEDLVPVFKKNLDGSFAQLEGEYIFDEHDSGDGLFVIRYYRPRIEGLFARIERWVAKSGAEIKWKVTTRDNVSTLFGWSAASRLSDPKDQRRIFEWLPEFVLDDKGNCCRYLYQKEDTEGFDTASFHNKNRIAVDKLAYANLYLHTVLYGNKTPYTSFGTSFPNEEDFLFSTVFDYGTTGLDERPDTFNTWDFRSDAFSDYKPGFEIRTTRLCKRVLLFHHFKGDNEYDGLVRSINFEYDTNAEEDFTFLKKIHTLGYIRRSDGSFSSKQLPPMEFAYQEHEWNSEIKTIAAEELIHATSGIADDRYQFTDLYNEGLSGLLTEQGGGWYYKHNLGDGKFEAAKLVSPKPSFNGLGAQLQLADLGSDGGKQLVNYTNGTSGYFELNEDNQWENFQAFKTLPNVNFGDDNTRMFDLNGDGKAELVISEESVFTWYPSEGRSGFSKANKTKKASDDEEAPAIVFSEVLQSIFLADMSGSGMSDIVRIRRNEVCYWPNLGYGKFGAKVTMDNAPVFDQPVDYNPAYIRLADIDGSGTTDIIYLGKNKFTCYKNLSGNRFGSSSFEIETFPEIHSLATVTVADLLGNGIACILWSSPLQKDNEAPLKYIDLMGGKKPHIMTGYKNNMGKEVSMEYIASTKFYIEDKLAGKPWVTKLHFPVHCISKTITEDKTSGHRFESSYKYHHGYYDHAEREFRGFGMVEQTDAETFEHWVRTGATNITEENLHQEPVVSKSWHHTGAFLRNDKILNHFEKDYWYNEFEKEFGAVTHPEIALADARLTVPEGMDAGLLNQLTADEWREALRACKGMALRSEVFANDAIKYGNTDEARKKEQTPFSVTTHNCVIELLQPKGKNKYAVFVVKESEAISYSYERNPEDPRISHSLNIKLDEYGNVLQSASVVYPRLVADASLPTETQQEQSKTVVIYTQNQFTNDVISDEAYRLRLPSEVKTFELKGVAKTHRYYALSDFADILSDAKSDTAFYHEVDKLLIAGKAQKRVIEHLRSTYYGSDLRIALPLHELESLAIPYESYQLAYTPELVSDIFQERVDGSMLELGKFTPSEGDDNWWIRSGTTQLLYGAETMADAVSRFYTPISYTDPCGAVTKVKYYGNYFLFIEETEDAMGNKAGVDLFNFRTLSPQRMRDINNNLSEAIGDELGLVKAMAVMGKGNQADDLLGLSEETTAEENALIQDFFSSSPSTEIHRIGKGLLQHASARFVYDFDTYQRSGKPAVVAAISRETHFRYPDGTESPESKLQVGFEYSSGLGEVIMQKVQAEPGKAKQVTVNFDNTISITDVNTAPQLRWIGNGRIIKNNKGNPVKQYEPYFSVTPQYENYKELVETGVTPVMYYDAAGRLIKTEMPDGTYSKVEFDSWKQVIYDANDTVLDSKWYLNRINRLIDDDLELEHRDPVKEKGAAEKSALHANTPSTIHLDSLGRSFCSIAHNKRQDFSKTPATLIEEFYSTTSVIDTEGNLRAVIDAAGNTVMQYKYDMLGNMLYQNSMDAGERWMLNDCMGKPLLAWDAKGHQFSSTYDVLQRPLSSALIKDGITFVTGKQNYCNPNELNAFELEQKQTLNLVGQSLIQYDSAGKTELIQVDFKGNVLKTSRQLCKDYKAIPDWVNPDTIEMEAEIFASTARFDALNRPVESLTPHTDLIPPSVILPVYNEAGMLNAVNAQLRGASSNTHFVTDINHDAKGQRESIYYGNNSMTRYSYDKQNFRLIRLLTTANSGTNTLQDLRYTYDAVGNITHILDFSQPTVFYNGEEVVAKNEYDYDAAYQLIRATGREHIGQNNTNESQSNNNVRNFPFEKGPTATDVNALRNYTQQYLYDAVGNILQMKHSANGASWTRHYWYNNNESDRNELDIDAATIKNNRLLQTQVGTNNTRYTHDIQGCMLNLPHLQEMVWNYKDQLQQVDLGGGGKAFYVYDGGGQRIRKVIERSVGNKEERLYLGAVEIYRETSSSGIITKQTDALHIMDNKSRIAMVDIPIIIPSSSEERQQVTRFIYGNHLGSSSLELNENAVNISYEEYHPYGTTSFSATNGDIKAAAKRYRYTGMERDEETGLEYHSARYYLPWLGRWLSADPIGAKGGVNFYAYVNNNPLTQHDPSGTDDEPCYFYDSDEMRIVEVECQTKSNPVDQVPTPAEPPPVKTRKKSAVLPPAPTPPPLDPATGQSVNSSDGWQLLDNPLWNTVTNDGIGLALTLTEQSLYRPGSFSLPFSQALNFRLSSEEMLSNLDNIKYNPALQSPFYKLLNSVNRVLAPLGLISNTKALYEAMFESDKTIPERTGDALAASTGLYSAFIGTAQLFGPVTSVLTRAVPYTAAFAGGYAFGQYLDEKTGWHHDLAYRGLRVEQLLKDVGVPDSISSILGGFASIPILSETSFGGLDPFVKVLYPDDIFVEN